MTMVITSLQNKLVKEAAGLKQKKHRDESGLFMAEGVRLCEEVATSDWLLETCFFTAEAAEDRRTGLVLNTLSTRGCTLIEVSPAILSKIAETEEPQGILVTVRQKKITLDEVLVAAKVPCIVVLDGVRDPGNAGTIIRTADAAGCTAVVLLQDCVDLYAGKTVRSTMGSLVHLPVIYSITTAEFLAVIKKYGLKLAVTAIDGAKPYYDASLTEAVAIVFGSESHGVSDELTAASSDKVYIPMLGKTESLNVASAAAIILYEAVRQRA
ncbi:MAG: tRNA/rRNA methyltransferase (SpoU) [Firmicutes bacterium]|nr:tRNA/rRNA methyltransferase (SpoU) [Bacillota bacterium]